MVSLRTARGIPSCRPTRQQMKLLIDTPEPSHSKFHSPGSVHVEQTHRCPACWRQTDDRAAAHGEVITPHICSRTEQSDYAACFGVNTGKISAFVRIAPVTSKCEPGNVIGSSVLA